MEENLNIIIYSSEDGKTKLDVKLENETLWLNQKQLCELFGKSKSTISEHIKTISNNAPSRKDSPKNIDFEKLYFNKMPLLRKAYERAKDGLKEEFKKFLEEERFWIDDFSLYMSIKNVCYSY